MSSKHSSTGMSNSERVKFLRCFYKIVSNVWESYQKSGPGSLQETWQGELKQSYDCVKKWFGQQHDGDLALQDEKLLSTCRDLYLLSLRCVVQSEGLCFVSGEAGLVPRRDLYDQFESSLKNLQSVCEND